MRPVVPGLRALSRRIIVRGAVDDNKGMEDERPSVAMNTMRAHQLQSEEDDDVNDVCVVKVLLVVPVSVSDSTDVSPILW